VGVNTCACVVPTPLMMARNASNNNTCIIHMHNKPVPLLLLVVLVVVLLPLPRRSPYPATTFLVKNPMYMWCSKSCLPSTLPRLGSHEGLSFFTCLLACCSQTLSKLTACKNPKRKNTTNFFFRILIYFIFLKQKQQQLLKNSQSLTSKGRTCLKALSCLKTAVERWQKQMLRKSRKHVGQQQRAK
jgi:hypothetical protein